MIIYHKRVEDRWWDTLTVHLHFPKIGRWVTLGPWDDENKNYGLDLHTNCILSKDTDRWLFCLQLLGFGFSIHRQWGY